MNRENFDIAIQKEILGVSEHNKGMIYKIQPGDTIVFYITKESILSGIFEVISGIFIDNEDVFKPIPSDKNQKFPFRIRIKPVRIFKDTIPLKLLIMKLNFIKNKKRWQVHFMGKAILSISKDDMDIIVNALK